MRSAPGHELEIEVGDGDAHRDTPAPGPEGRKRVHVRGIAPPARLERRARRGGDSLKTE